MLILSLLLGCTPDTCGILSVDSPADDSWTAGDPVLVSATAPGGEIVLTVDGDEVGRSIDTLSTDWDPADVADGSHAFVFSVEGCDSVTRNVGVDRVAPEVALDAEVAGSVLTFVVNATDEQGVVGAEALLDGVTVTSPAALTAGSHTLEGRAWDAAGNVGTVSTAVSPTSLSVQFTSPADGATVSGVVSVQAEASSSAGIAGLVVTLDGVELASGGGETLSVDWDTCAGVSGAHTLEAEAEASDGSTATASVTVTVEMPDADEDGVDVCGDCDDTDSDISGDEPEICGDGIDQGCDGVAVGCGPEGELDPAGSLVYEGVVAAPDNDTWVVVADFDLDGAGEVAIGSPNEGADSGSWEGAVRIAPTAPYGLVDLDTAVLHDGWESYGAAGRVLAAGDLQGDDRPELVVSEPGLNPTPRGRVYVLADDEILTDTPLEDVAIQLPGLTEEDGIADQLAVTDIDGDGQDDLVAGAGGPFGSYGVVYLVPGPIDATTTFSDDLSIVGSGAAQYIGMTMCAGDYDGDGHQDVLVGTFDGEVAAWLVTGPITGEVEVRNQPDKLRRVAAGDQAGGTMGCGDIDRDGVADPMLGALREDAGGTYAGAAYFVHGPFSGSQSLGAADAIIYGDTEWAYFGYSMATGDFDADGLGDVAVGVPTANTYTGGFYIFSDLFGSDPDMASPTAYVSGGYMGYGLFTGDATGDGVDDLIAPSTVPTTSTGVRGSVRVFAGGSEF